MAKCSVCRKAEEDLDSWWDKVRLFFFHFFHNDIVDLSQQKYTQGFADGYKVGGEHAVTTPKLAEEVIAEVNTEENLEYIYVKEMEAYNSAVES